MDNSRLAIGLASAGALAVVLHCALFTFAPAIAAAMSPVHALCCALILMMLHPAAPAIWERYHTFGGRHVDANALMCDPVIQGAMRLPPPPAPWQQTIQALGLAALADFCEALRSRGTGDASAVARVWEGAHESLTAASVGLLLYGSWRLGVPPSRFLQATCWGVATSGGVQLLLSAPQPPADAGWAALTCVGLAACRTFVSCAFVGRSASGLVGAITVKMGGPRGRVRSLSSAVDGESAADLGRWTLQAVGSLLLLTPSALTALLPGEGALDLIVSRPGPLGAGYRVQGGMARPHGLTSTGTSG